MMQQWKRKGKKYRLYGPNGTQAAIKEVETEVKQGEDKVVQKIRMRKYYQLSLRGKDGHWTRIFDKRGVVDFRDLAKAKKTGARKLVAMG